MIINTNIFISKDRKVRVSSRNSEPNADEIALRLNIDVPDIFFKRPIPQVSLEVPQNYLVNPNCKVIAAVSAQAIAKSLNLELKTVEDGLLVMLKDKFESEKLARGEK